MISNICFGQSYDIEGAIRNGIDSTKSIGVIVRLAQGSKIVSETVSDETGKFNFSNLEAGTYNLKLSTLGYSDHTEVCIVIDSSEMSELTIFYPCPIGRSKNKKFCP